MLKEEEIHHLSNNNKLRLNDSEEHSYEDIDFPSSANLRYNMLNLTNKKHFDESVYDRYMQEMLHNRNSQMLKKISGEFEKGNVFVAVGILHLISKHGLLEKLYNKGYVIEEIY